MPNNTTQIPVQAIPPEILSPQTGDTVPITFGVVGSLDAKDGTLVTVGLSGGGVTGAATATVTAKAWSTPITASQPGVCTVTATSSLPHSMPGVVVANAVSVGSNVVVSEDDEPD